MVRGHRTHQSRASAAAPSAVVHRLLVGRVDVGRGEVWAPAYEPESVAPLPGLQCGIGGGSFGAAAVANSSHFLPAGRSVYS